MSSQSQLALGILGVLTAILAFGAYRWLQRRRVSRVNDWVTAFLLNRYGDVPKNLHIHCTNDQLWPVLVSFNGPPSGSHHRMQFRCSGAQSTFRLESENVDQRAGIP
jgi:hypothetical protein